MKKLLYILCATAVFTVCCGNVGCGGGGGSSASHESLAVESAYGDYADYETAAVEDEVIATPVTDGDGNLAAAAKNTQKIIKTGRMGLDVDKDIATAKAAIDALVTGSGGYYSSEEFSESNYSSDYSLSIRIPAARYETFIATLESGGYGSVRYKDIEAKDVTEEFLDIETRLGNKRSYLERYRELLKRATTIKDIMEIEEQVRSLEEEIESAEGRLRYLGDRVSYSTLDLSLTREKAYKPTKGQSFGNGILKALSGGWNILKALVIGLITLWPLWIIAAAVLVPVIHTQRKKRKARLQ